MTASQISANNSRIKFTGLSVAAATSLLLLSLLLTHGLELFSNEALFVYQAALLGVIYALGYSLIVLCIRGNILAKKLMT